MKNTHTKTPYVKQNNNWWKHRTSGILICWLVFVAIKQMPDQQLCELLNNWHDTPFYPLLLLFFAAGIEMCIETDGEKEIVFMSRVFWNWF